MNLSISTISFQGETATNRNKISLSERLKRFNTQGNSLTDPIDNGDPRTAKRGSCYPTPFEDCFERMSFETDIEDNMWRDAQYEDEITLSRNLHSDYSTPNIITEKAYIENYYSIDDIPVADSNIRRRLGLNSLADVHLDIDTDMTPRSIRTLNKINYYENIVLKALQGTPPFDASTIDEFAAWASAYQEDGYAKSSIIRAMERSSLTNFKTGAKQPNIELFKFLIEYPNLRPLVVIKTENSEKFDKTFANYYRIFNRNYFSDSKEVVKALELCKVNDNGNLHTSRELCEIVALLRRKTAQTPTSKEVIYTDYNDESAYQRQKKYVNPNNPLTENDITLIQKLKPDNKLDTEMYSVAKSLLTTEQKDVGYILENIDLLVVPKTMKPVDEITKPQKTEISSPTKKNFTEAEINAEIDKIFKRLLGSDRMLTYPDDETIAILKAADKDIQPELINLINEMLDKWCSSTEISRVLKEKFRHLYWR